MGDKDKAILCSCSNEDCRWNGCMIVRQQLQKPEIVYAGISRGHIAKPCVYEDGRPLREIIESQQREIDRLQVMAMESEVLRERCRVAKAENDRLREELEVERMRLAACGVAAIGYFNGCKDEYRSASLEDVIRLYKQRTARGERMSTIKETYELRNGDSVIRTAYSQNKLIEDFIDACRGSDSDIKIVRIRLSEGVVLNRKVYDSIKHNSAG